MKNYTAIFIDYFLQHCEYGANKKEASEKALDLMKSYKDEISDSDYFLTEELLKRLAVI